MICTEVSNKRTAKPSMAPIITSPEARSANPQPVRGSRAGSTTTTGKSQMAMARLMPALAMAGTLFEPKKGRVTMMALVRSRISTKPAHCPKLKSPNIKFSPHLMYWGKLTNMPSVNASSLFSIQGPKNKSPAITARILGTKVSVISWIWVTDWKMLTMRAHDHAQAQHGQGQQQGWFPPPGGKNLK